MIINMFWIVLFIVIILALFIDQTTGIFDSKVEISEGKLFIKGLFRKKVIDIQSITSLRILIDSFGNQLIQLRIKDSLWDTSIGRITLTNYKKNAKMLEEILRINPAIEVYPELKNYLNARSIGDYYINRSQIKKGLLVLGVILFGIILTLIFNPD